jgi:radical SAM superfamily enzyme YgiQ (UPF0313 family)
MKKCMLFNPPSALSVYNTSRVKAAIPKLPNLSLAMIAGSLIEEGFNVQIIDLTLMDIKEIWPVVSKEISRLKPDIVGITATTPLFYEAVKISDIAKALSENILTVLGGPHASALPLDSLRESSFDCVVAGEGEIAIKEIARSNDFKGIKGVYCRRHTEKEIATEEIQKTLDIPIEDLPLPALNLFDARNYACPKVIAKRNPVGPIEISRGCVFNCIFCNKKVFGRRFRIKPPKRVVEELLILKRLGYREFHVLDDQFTTEIDKAKEICQEIISSGIDMTWNLRTGVRVDTIDKEFLELAKRAGCYQVGVGFESGSQASLDKMGKGIKLEQAIRASELIKKTGIELVGFFILGFPGETIEETIRFAIKLNPDYAKATILVPFPGTEIYNEFKSKGLIKTNDWSKYNFHSAYEIYRHPNFSWDTLNYYYNLFHRRFYFRPNYLLRRCWKSMIQGKLFNDLFYGYQTFFKES